MTRSFTASTFVINVIVEQWQHAEQTANCDANNSALETHTHSALIQHYVSMTLPATCSTAAELIMSSSLCPRCPVVCPVPNWTCPRHHTCCSRGTTWLLSSSYYYHIASATILSHLSLVRLYSSFLVLISFSLFHSVLIFFNNTLFFVTVHFRPSM